MASIFSQTFDTETSPRQIINESRTTRTFSLTLMPTKVHIMGSSIDNCLLFLDIRSKSHYESKRPLQKHSSFCHLFVLVEFSLRDQHVSLCRLTHAFSVMCGCGLSFHFSKGCFAHETIDVNPTLNSVSSTECGAIVSHLIWVEFWLIDQ